MVGRGESILQPVDVRDVAEAVAAALDRPRSIGGTYDVVGPDRLPLAEVVRVVADGIGLNVHIVPTPLPVQRVAVRVMDAVTSQPLSTPAQLQMLVDGLYGDTKPARRDLGLVPRPFTAEAVRAVEGAIGSLFGMSLRLLDGRGHAEWLARYRPALVPALALAVVALLVQTVLALAVANVWYRMAVGGLVLSTFALARVRLDWRALYRPSWRNFARAPPPAAVMYAVGGLVARLLTASPARRADRRALRMAAHGASALAFRCSSPSCSGKIVWRNAVTLPLAAGWTWRGAAAGPLCALAHLPWGAVPPPGRDGRGLVLERARAEDAERRTRAGEPRAPRPGRPVLVSLRARMSLESVVRLAGLGQLALAAASTAIPTSAVAHGDGAPPHAPPVFGSTPFTSWDFTSPSACCRFSLRAGCSTARAWPPPSPASSRRTGACLSCSSRTSTGRTPQGGWFSAARRARIALRFPERHLRRRSVANLSR